MKIRRVFLENRYDAGMGWEISGPYYTATGWSFAETINEYKTKSRQWERLAKTTKHP